MPLLGVHFTPRVDGTLWLGPNAVPAFCREGYTYADVNVRELVDLLLFPGTWRVLVRHARFGVGEMYRSLSIAVQVKELPVWDGICMRGMYMWTCLCLCVSVCMRVGYVPLLGGVCFEAHWPQTLS